MLQKVSFVVLIKVRITKEVFKIKRIISLILSIIMLAVGCLNVSASNALENTDKTTYIESTVTPRYAFLSLVNAGISEGTLGFVNCSSTYSCSHEDYTFVLTCTLQRTDGTTVWVDYKTATETFTEVGVNGISKTWYAPAGYAYRTYTTVVVKNSRTSKVVETATCDSPVIYK